MNGPEILVPIAFFASVTMIVINVLRYRERTHAHRQVGAHEGGEISQRLERMEQAIDAIAVEVERIAEGQRFTTRLLSERHDERVLPRAEREPRDRMGG